MNTPALVPTEADPEIEVSNALVACGRARGAVLLGKNDIPRGRGATLRAVEIAKDVACHLHLAGMGPRALQARIEGGELAAHGFIGARA